MVTMDVQVQHVQEGDRFGGPGEPGWVAVEDAVTDGHEPTTTMVRVQFKPDGGLGYREWDNPAHTITIEREADNG